MKIVPMNFGYVEEQIFRCGAPEPKNFPFLETLQIRTCIILNPEGPPPPFAEWLKENRIHVLHPLAVKENSIVETVVVDTLTILLNPNFYPILMTCPMGRYWTGTIVGCLRKLQRWNLTSILEEYRRYASYKGRLENEEFIELFDVEAVHLPPDVVPTILYQ